jgi:hypothetical protein
MIGKSRLLMSLRTVVLFAVAGFVSPAVFAQPINVCQGAKAGSLACLTVDLTNANQKSLGLPLGQPLGVTDTGISLLAGQLSSAAPLPSPASGFVYSFNPTTGLFTQSSASYGPILSERAETIGAHRFSLGFVDQYFDFTKVDGIRVSSIPVVATLASGVYLAGTYNLHFRLNQFTMFGGYGLTNFLAISVAAPIVSAQIGGSLREQLQVGPATNFSSATINRSATGFGDLQFQLKANLVRSEGAGLALGVNVRTPTGNPYALSGAGSVGIEPFVAASTTIRGWIAPHVNVGYQWNGKSVLAGDVPTEAKRNLPANISYAAGAEFAIKRRVTIVEDLIGRELIHAERAVLGLNQEFDGATVPGVGFIRKSLNSTSLSSGLKFNPGGHFLLVLNLLARVNNGGLRAAVVPLIGLSYVFQAPRVADVSPHLTKDAGIPDRITQVPAVIDMQAPKPALSSLNELPSRDTSPDAVKGKQRSHQPELDRMAKELNSVAHFALDAPPEFLAFHNGIYLHLPVITTLPKIAAGSQYRLAALAFDQHIAHLIRPVLEYFKAQDFEGIDFGTSVRLAGDASTEGSLVAVEFIFPLILLRSYAQFDCTGQQLIDASYVLINGERVSLNLQIAEAGARLQ